MSKNTTKPILESLQSKHKIVSREEWIKARKELLEEEKALTRRNDELARWRRELPWVRIDKEYQFESDGGTMTLSDLFRGRSQLLIYHFMFGPDFKAGCPSCSSIADGFNGIAVHLENHDVSFSAVSRAPFAKLKAYKKRMGWSFLWASSLHSDFNFDFHVTHGKEQEESGAVEYNYRITDERPSQEKARPEEPWMKEIAGGAGTDWPTFRRELPGMSAFVLEGGVIYHSYSAYSRGLDALWGMYPWLDRAPFGRNENGIWWKRHDEYGTVPKAGGSCCHGE